MKNLPDDFNQLPLEFIELLYAAYNARFPEAYISSGVHDVLSDNLTVVPIQRPAIQPSEVFEFSKFLGLPDKECLDIVRYKHD